MSTQKDTQLRRRLKLLLELTSHNQASLAKKLGITPAYVSELLAGKKNTISPSLAKLIMHTLRCDEEWLRSGATDPILGPALEREMQEAWKSPRAVAQSVGVNTGFIEAVLASRIMPSPELTAAIRRSLTGEIDRGTVSAGSGGRPADRRLLEVEHLLAEDPDAIAVVLQLLRARKAQREAIDHLRGPVD
jgi:predicted XRE-type DNA-binding protein